MKLRISLVDYLNAAPLGWSFLHGPLRGRQTLVFPQGLLDLLPLGF